MDAEKKGYCCYSNNLQLLDLLMICVSVEMIKQLEKKECFIPLILSYLVHLDFVNK